MIEGVEQMGDARRYVKEVLDRKERLMGFGHRVYRAYDPRAAVLRDTCKRLGAPRYEVALELEKAAIAELAERHPERRMETNVDYWAAVLLDFADVPGDMMTPLFACARTAGWSAHILEQKKTGRLIRPSSRYVGHGPASDRGRQGLRPGPLTREPGERRRRPAGGPPGSTGNRVPRRSHVVDLPSGIRSRSGGWMPVTGRRRRRPAAPVHRRGGRPPPRPHPTPTPENLVSDPPRSPSPPTCCPADGRFGSGPSKVRPAQVEAARRDRPHGARHVPPPGAR